MTALVFSDTGEYWTDFATRKERVFDSSREVGGGWNYIPVTLTDYVGQAILVVFVNHGDIFFAYCIFLLSLWPLMSFYAHGKNGFFGVVDSVLCSVLGLLRQVQKEH